MAKYNTSFSIIFFLARQSFASVCKGKKAGFLDYYHNQPPIRVKQRGMSRQRVMQSSYTQYRLRTKATKRVSNLISFIFVAEKFFYLALKSHYLVFCSVLYCHHFTFYKFFLFCKFLTNGLRSVSLKLSSRSNTFK